MKKFILQNKNNITPPFFYPKQNREIKAERNNALSDSNSFNTDLIGNARNSTFDSRFAENQLRPNNEYNKRQDTKTKNSKSAIDNFLKENPNVQSLNKNIYKTSSEAYERFIERHCTLSSKIDERK